MFVFLGAGDLFVFHPLKNCKDPPKCRRLRMIYAIMSYHNRLAGGKEAQGEEKVASS